MKKILLFILLLTLLTCSLPLPISAEDAPTAKITATLVGDTIPVAGEKFTIAISASEITSNLFVSGQICFDYPAHVVTPVKYTAVEPTTMKNIKQMIGGVTNKYSSTEGTGKFSTISKINTETGQGVIAVYIDISAEDQTAEFLNNGIFNMFGFAFMLNEGYTYDDFYFSVTDSTLFLTADKRIASKYKNGRIILEGIKSTSNNTSGNSINQLQSDVLKDSSLNVKATYVQI